jgi:hypothetical protein
MDSQRSTIGIVVAVSATGDSRRRTDCWITANSSLGRVAIRQALAGDLRAIGGFHASNQHFRAASISLDGKIPVSSTK